MHSITMIATAVNNKTEITKITLSRTHTSAKAADWPRRAVARHRSVKSYAPLPPPSPDDVTRHILMMLYSK